jgi:hypothetical protein
MDPTNEDELENLRRELAEARWQNQKATLGEYLLNCHIHLYTKFKLAAMSESATGFARVEGKYYPRWLHPWDHFASVLRPRHLKAMRRVCGERRPTPFGDPPADAL